MTSEQGSPANGDGRSGLAARFLRGVDGSITELVLEYDGLAPPVALFADLAAAGWSAPVPAPPPASAIDWSRPDPATGKAFSVRPYRAEGRSRPQGRSALAAERVQEVIERHRRAVGARIGSEAEAATGSQSAPVDPTNSATTVIVVTLPPERVDALVGSNPGVEVVRRTPATREVTGMYRGQPSVVVMPAVELELRAGPATIRTLLQTLSDVEGVQVNLHA